jgi:hypothetical protein
MRHAASASLWSIVWLLAAQYDGGSGNSFADYHSVTPHDTLTHSLTHYTPTPTHPLTHSLTHSLTHALTHTIKEVSR